VVRVVFRELTGKGPRVVAVHAKRARGMLVDFVVRNRITRVEKLKQFNRSGYRFDEAASSSEQLCFLRPAQ
jgi:cytoplasmic iron level regulating protein YaaA (DUF328/UPF0246 family)